MKSLTRRTNSHISLPIILSLRQTPYMTDKEAKEHLKNDVIHSDQKLSSREQTRPTTAHENIRHAKIKDYLSEERLQQKKERVMNEWSRYISEAFSGSQLKSQVSFKIRPAAVSPRPVNVRILKESCHKKCVLSPGKIKYDLVKPKSIFLANCNKKILKEAGLEKIKSIKFSKLQFIYDNEPLLSSNPKREWRAFEPDAALVNMYDRELKDDIQQWKEKYVKQKKYKRFY